MTCLFDLLELRHGILVLETWCKRPSMVVQRPVIGHVVQSIQERFVKYCVVWDVAV